MRLLQSLSLLLLTVTITSASQFMRTPAGLIKGARLTYVSGTTVKVGVGYGDDAGDYWEIGASDTYNTTGYTLTGLSTSTLGVVQYIYIDRTNSSFPSITLTNSTTAPVWSDSYMGWYNGSNRCIAAVWVQPSGSVINFTCPADDIYIFPGVTLLVDHVFSTTPNVWHTFDCTPYAPVNASAVRLAQDLNGGSWTFCMSGMWANGGLAVVEYGNSAGSDVQGWMQFPRGVTKSVQYQAWASSTSGTEYLYYMAYQLER
ncbi:MAG TPA: hypothetical protein VHA37_00765 [Candidatus Saccharimonadales bacterium]|nr:hypothetical protein [Candidatus Saccharimonadales bacterium]